MIELLLVAIASIDGNSSRIPPCLPMLIDQSQAPSAIEDHQPLRQAVDEPMPKSPTMVMLYGKGGHLATQEYSIIVDRDSDGVWRGPSVSRSRISVKDAPHGPTKRVKWTIGKSAGRQLDDVLVRRCPSESKVTAEPGNSVPPPFDSILIPERIDLVMPGVTATPFYKEQGEGIAALIRPPQ